MNSRLAGLRIKLDQHFLVHMVFNCFEEILIHLRIVGKNNDLVAQLEFRQGLQGAVPILGVGVADGRVNHQRNTAFGNLHQSQTKGNAKTPPLKTRRRAQMKFLPIWTLPKRRFVVENLDFPLLELFGGDFLEVFVHHLLQTFRNNLF